MRAGLTLVKDARKVGRLGEGLTQWAGRSAREVYHDATFDKERAQELFNTGVLSLRDRAIGEQIYLATITAVARIASRSGRRSASCQIRPAMKML